MFAAPPPVEAPEPPATFDEEDDTMLGKEDDLEQRDELSLASPTPEDDSALLPLEDDADDTRAGARRRDATPAPVSPVAATALAPLDDGLEELSLAPDELVSDVAIQAPPDSLESLDALISDPDELDEVDELDGAARISVPAPPPRLSAPPPPPPPRPPTRGPSLPPPLPPPPKKR